MNVKKIITLLLALVLAAGMVACGTKPAEDTDGKDGSEEAKALYEQLMAQENAILSENTALWEKVFMAADRGRRQLRRFSAQDHRECQGSVHRGGADAAHRRGHQDQGY